MRIKLSFSENKIPFTTPVQSYVNGMFHSLFGKNNIYHNTFSKYSVSQLFGGTLTDREVNYPTGGYLYISSIDSDLMSNIASAIFSLDVEIRIGDMSLKSIEIEDYSPHMKYDIIRVNNLCLKDYSDKLITFNDPNFMDVLITKTTKKLLNNGISESDLKNFKIVPFHFENAKVKYFEMKPGHKGIKTSNVMFLVEGTKETRRTLYELGFGSSTGCGCGTVKIINKK